MFPFIRNIKTLGPGFLFAASAVGVSHLVQSTRAGAEYNLALAGIILLACLIKYPGFRFSVDYTVSTGQTLLFSYKKQGMLILQTYFILLLLDIFITTAAISFVTAGIFRNIFSIQPGSRMVAACLMVSFAVFLISGSYPLFERTIKNLVILFSCLVVASTALSLPELNNEPLLFLPPLILEKEYILFVIAVSGRMPTAISASVFLSVWIHEKRRHTDKAITLAEARTDFHAGYICSVLLALCFVVLGAALMFNKGIAVTGSSSGFAAQLMQIFQYTIGDWAYPLIALTCLVVMASTLLVLLDIFPRTVTAVVNISVRHKDETTPASQKKLYLFFISLQVIGAVFILSISPDNFKILVDLSASIAFLISPFIAYFNHRAIHSPEVPPGARPGVILYYWNILGIIISLFFCLLYFYYRFIL